MDHSICVACHGRVRQLFSRVCCCAMPQRTGETAHRMYEACVDMLCALKMCAERCRASLRRSEGTDRRSQFKRNHAQYIGRMCSCSRFVAWLLGKLDMLVAALLISYLSLCRINLYSHTAVPGRLKCISVPSCPRWSRSLCARLFEIVLFAVVD